MNDEELKVIIGDHISWEFAATYYKNVSDCYLLLHGLSKALLMGDDKTASAEINRLCDLFENKEIAEEYRAEYLKKAKLLKPVAWPSYLPKPNI